MRTKTLFAVFVLVHFTLIACAQKQQVRIVFKEPVQLTPERGFQQTAKGHFVSENDSILYFRPIFDPTSILSVRKNTIEVYTINGVAATKPTVVQSTASTEEKLDKKRVQSEARSRYAEVFPMVQVTTRHKKGEQVRRIRGYPIEMDSFSITIVQKDYLDTTRLSVDDIYSIRILNNGTLIGTAIGTTIAAGSVINFRNQTRNVPPGLAQLSTLGLFLVTSAIVVVTPIAGLVTGSRTEFFNVHGKRRRYYRAMRKIQKW